MKDNKNKGVLVAIAVVVVFVAAVATYFLLGSDGGGGLRHDFNSTANNTVTILS